MVNQVVRSSDPISLPVDSLQPSPFPLDFYADQMGSTSPPTRTASISRITAETKIQVSLSLDGGRLPAFETSEHFPSNNSLGVTPSEKTHATQFTASQQITVDTGIGFLDHMLHALAKHAGWSLGVRCKGDLYSTSSHSSLHENVPLLIR